MTSLTFIVALLCAAILRRKLQDHPMSRIDTAALRRGRTAVVCIALMRHLSIVVSTYRVLIKRHRPSAAQARVARASRAKLVRGCISWKTSYAGVGLERGTGSQLRQLGKYESRGAARLASDVEPNLQHNSRPHRSFGGGLFERRFRRRNHPGSLPGNGPRATTLNTLSSRTNRKRVRTTAPGNER